MAHGHITLGNRNGLMFDDRITPDWWHDPVLLALDFTPVLACDARTDECALAAHPAVWRCFLTCGCTLLLCDETLWVIAPWMLDVTDCRCPRCGTSGAFITRGRGI